MNHAEDQIVCSAMTEMVNFIWDILHRTRQNVSSVVDEARAQVLARELSYLLEWYEGSGGKNLSPTTAWMIKEVVEAVSDLTDTHRKS